MRLFLFYHNDVPWREDQNHDQLERSHTRHLPSFQNGSGRSSRLAFDGSLPLLYSIFVSSTRKRLNTLYVLKGYAWNTRLSVPKTRNPSSIFFLSDASNSLLSWQYMSIVVVPSACPMTCESIVVGTPFLCMFVPKQRRPECGVMSSAMILLFNSRRTP